MAVSNARCHAVHLRNDRGGAQGGQVAFGHETLAVAALHHVAHARIGGEGLHGGQKGVGQGHVGSVQGLGSVKAQRGDGAVALPSLHWGLRPSS